MSAVEVLLIRLLTLRRVIDVFQCCRRQLSSTAGSPLPDCHRTMCRAFERQLTCRIHYAQNLGLLRSEPFRTTCYTGVAIYNARVGVRLFESDSGTEPLTADSTPTVISRVYSLCMLSMISDFHMEEHDWLNE